MIGFGINLSFPKQTQQIDQPWAELIEVLPTIDRNKLIAELGKKLIARLQHFEQAGIDEAFRQDWRDMDAYFGEEVHVLTENHKITGIAQGIDKRGYLQLITSEGMQYFNGGEVSLRKAS